jgi:5-carboxymethyl-2-hydroxymuconate isomerase
MVHLHLETTADLPENADIPDILEALCQTLVTEMEVDPGQTRACHTLRSVWYVGQGAPPAFVHLTVAVLSDSAQYWRSMAARRLLHVLLEHFRASIDAHEANVTVEVRETDVASYAASF